MILGILGVGHLAAAVLTGLIRSGFDAQDILLSPRGQGPELAAAHGFALAVDNTDLVRRSDIVLLAVRPAAALTAVTGLPWRDGQILVSACAGVSVATLDTAAAPARIARIMPLTAAEICKSPTLLYPDLPQVRALLNRIGPVIAVPDEGAFEVATVSAAVYGWAQMLIGRTAEWSAARGLPPETARALVARTFEAAGALIAEKPDPIGDLLHELVTPGGITERGLNVLDAAAVPQGWDAACQAVLDKLRG